MSLQVGSVRLRERFGAEPSLRALDDAVDGLLEPARGVTAGACTLVGAGGTPATLQAWALGLDRDDPEVIQGTVLEGDRIGAARAALASMTLGERDALPFMPPGRGDVIVAGASILLGALRIAGLDRVVVSETDILDALAADALRGAAGGVG
jgi:exopolyphosphatase/guanosine-5'-triphosphate,3'-diphosphate pyrophosphatase